MQNRIAKYILCFLLPIVMLCLSGCLVKLPEELYALPQQSEAYYDLQDHIDQVIHGDTVYCAPVSGENRQPLQMKDLDGDGQQEAIVFAKGTGEKPLKIYIFARSNDTFSLVSVIEGDGTSFESVRYAQVDGSPGLEIIVGRSINDQVFKALSVYSFQGNSSVELMSSNYSAYTTTDLDGDGRTDLFLIRFDSEMQTGTAELYRYNSGVMVREPELPLTQRVTSIKRITTGYMEEGVPAVFVAGALDENTLVTDVFAFQNGSLQNIANATDASGSLTVRNYYAYGADIDNDGLIELPEVETLPQDTQENESFRLIHWYNLCLDGTKAYKMLTYHDYSYGFYLELEESWSGKVTITLDESVEEGTAYAFSRWNRTTKTEEEIFTIYLFTGDHAAELAESDGRFYLAEKNEVTYAASLGSSRWAEDLTEQDLVDRFHFILEDWNSGII